jgi:hypothetical protein
MSHFLAMAVLRQVQGCQDQLMSLWTSQAIFISLDSGNNRVRKGRVDGAAKAPAIVHLNGPIDDSFPKFGETRIR